MAMELRLNHEMMWTPDPVVEAARKLPDWKRFHSACGDVGLCFDFTARPSHKGPFTAVAFTHRRNDHGGWVAIELARASHRDLVTAMRQAHDESGRGTAETSAMIEAGLLGVSEPEDDFERMLG